VAKQRPPAIGELVVNPDGGIPMLVTPPLPSEGFVVSQTEAPVRRKKAQPQPPPVVEVDAKYPEPLRDMLYVSKNCIRHDRTEGHRLLRRFMRKDPKGFTLQLHKLMGEWEERERAKELAAQQVAVRDMGAERAKELMALSPAPAVTAWRAFRR